MHFGDKQDGPEAPADLRRGGRPRHGFEGGAASAHNATGINFFTQEVVPKRLRLLHDLVPKAVRVAVLLNPANASVTESTLRIVQETTPTIGMQIQFLNATTIGEINAAFATLERERPVPSSSLEMPFSSAQAAGEAGPVMKLKPFVDEREKAGEISKSDAENLRRVIEFVDEREQAGDDYIMAFVKLLFSDIPLDHFTRTFIATLLLLHSRPTRTQFKQTYNKMVAHVYKARKRQLINGGMRALAAEEAIAEEWGMTREALLKKVQRAK